MEINVKRKNIKSLFFLFFENNIWIPINENKKNLNKYPPAKCSSPNGPDLFTKEPLYPKRSLPDKNCRIISNETNEQKIRHDIKKIFKLIKFLSNNLLITNANNKYLKNKIDLINLSSLNKLKFWTISFR